MAGGGVEFCAFAAACTAAAASVTADVAAANFTAPAIIVIGEVVKLRDGLDWLGALEGRVLKRDPLNLRAKKDVG